LKHNEAQRPVELTIATEGYVARELILPATSEFLEKNPNLKIVLDERASIADVVSGNLHCGIFLDNDFLYASEQKKRKDLMKKGVVFHHLGVLPRITCASPEYIARHRIKNQNPDLSDHIMVRAVSASTGKGLGFENTSGRNLTVRFKEPRLEISHSETCAAAARLGLGLVQGIRDWFARDLVAGTVVEVDGDRPPSPIAVTFLYHTDYEKDRYKEKVIAFRSWMESNFQAKLNLPEQEQ
jgi:DNA-binding transcriptional LysR family regulator